jgi:hypothetical protein
MNLPHRGGPPPSVRVSRVRILRVPRTGGRDNFRALLIDGTTPLRASCRGFGWTVQPRTCLQRLGLTAPGLTFDDVSVIEVNEAFASVVLQTLADGGLHERWEAGDVNPNGGGISLGHPLGATGARITATLLCELERRNGRYGIASMCIGVGQAIAAVVERL